MATLTTGSRTAVVISTEDLTLDKIISVTRRGVAVALSDDPSFRAMLQRGRDTLERKLKQGEIVYGVNTGFGGNARCLIPDEELAHHQQNLLEYLCCGVGEPLPEDAVRGTIL